ncbi:MAG: twin-arginine translocase subunit TatB [Acholeplasmataceae bacterium]|nr:Sec-independent protein translocase protein TatB [Acidaminococcaceae bacterium]NLY83403.1 twin-arginine translocase subunit TatB [Acholeplasmataceae bacterium]
MSIGLGEIFVVLLVAFLVVGPEDLPKIARTLALWVKKIRTTMKDLTTSFEKEMELDKVKKDINNFSSEVEKAQQEVFRQAAEAEQSMKPQPENIQENTVTATLSQEVMK